MSIITESSLLQTINRTIDSGARHLWIMQLSADWLFNPRRNILDSNVNRSSWQVERDEIDRVLLKALLTNQVRSIHRAVLYDVVSDAGDRLSPFPVGAPAVHRRVAEELRSWKRDLSRHIAFFDDGTASHELDTITARLSVQEVILGRVTDAASIYDQIWAGDHDGCETTDSPTAPRSWRHIGRMISLHGNFSVPREDRDPLSAIPTLELTEYRRR